MKIYNQFINEPYSFLVKDNIIESNQWQIRKELKMENCNMVLINK